MKLRETTLHQLLLGGIVFIAAVALIGPRIYADLTTSSETEDEIMLPGYTSGNTFDCYRQVQTCLPGSTTNCTTRNESIRCNDTYCNMNVGKCIPTAGQTGLSSSQASSSISRSQTSSNASAANNGKCILTKFECKDGAESANCFKRMRSKEVSCEDRTCVNGSCMTSMLFFMSNQLQPWDTEGLKGPFPRTETMCQIRKSSCLPGDTTCLSDVTFEQTSCNDPRCSTAGSCTQSTVKVDGNDNIIGETRTTGGTTTTTATDRSTGNGLPVEMEFPQYNAQDRTVAGSTESSTTQQPGVEQRRALGCFRPDGTWTTVRTECDADQSKYIDQRNAQTLTPPADRTTTGPAVVFDAAHEAEVREKIEERFFSYEERKVQLDALLSTASNAVERLQILRNRQELLPQDVISKVIETIEWLNQIQATFSEGTHSVDEIRQQAEDVHVRISATQILVTNALQQSGVVIERRPETLLTKMDRIFAAIPNALSLMQSEAVVIPAQALQHFLDAQNAYKAIKPECEANADACLKLSQVIDYLEPMIALLKESINSSGKPELIDQINILMQQ